MSTIESNSIRLFPEIDCGRSGSDRGLPCQIVPSAVAQGRTLEVSPTFIVNLGPITVQIRRADLDEFLQRNPSLNSGPSLQPADIVARIYRDRTPSPLPIGSPPPPAPLFEYPIWKTMVAIDPFRTNIFSFITKHIKRFPYQSMRQGQPNFPFSYLHSLLTSCPASLPLDRQIELTTKRLVQEQTSQSQQALGIGLYDPKVVEKILADFKEYRSPHIVFVGDFDEKIKTELQPQLSRLIEEFPKDAYGKTSCILHPDDPTILIACTKTGENVYEFSLRHAHSIPDEKKEALVHALLEPHYSPGTVKAILCGLSFDWFGFYRPDEDDPTIFHQTHQVKGLKIFLHCSGKIVADIARERVGSGASKGFKSKYTLHLDGTLIKKTGRATALKSRSPSHQPIWDEKFLTDANHEVFVREDLGEVPGLLPFYISGRYYSRKNPTQLKTRFESMLCEGTIENLVYDSKGKPLPPDQRKTLSALYAAYDALRALDVIHREEFVVHDVKPANVLWTAGESRTEGKLCDLGFATSIDEPRSDLGTIEFKSPERIWPKTGQGNDPASDLFAYGYLLLFMYLPEFRHEIDCLQGGAFCLFGYTPLSEGQYIASLNQLRSRIPQTKLGELIVDLINPDPSLRPSTAVALERYTKLLPKLERDPYVDCCSM